MQVILLEDVNKLGDMGDIVDVKPGYARNYLIPQGLALRASTGQVNQLRHQKQMIEARKVRLHNEAQVLRRQLDQLSVTIAKKVGEGDRLYGSVTNRDIAAAMGALGHTVNPKKLMMDGPLRELGIYAIRIKLHSDVVADIRVWVVAV